MSRRNGRRAKARADAQERQLEKKSEIEEEKMEKQLENQAQLQGLKFNDEGQISQQFLESVSDTTDLQTQTVNILQNYLTKTWIFSNLTEAEVHDIRWKMRAMYLKIKAHHPPEESAVTGELRAFVLDDPSAAVEPLTDEQRFAIETILDTIIMAVVPRARGGFERKQLNTQVRESRTRRTEEAEDDGGRFGLFS